MFLTLGNLILQFVQDAQLPLKEKWIKTQRGMCNGGLFFCYLTEVLLRMSRPFHCLCISLLIYNLASGITWNYSAVSSGTSRITALERTWMSSSVVKSEGKTWVSYLLNLCHSQICVFVQGFPLFRRCEQMYCTETAFILKRSRSKDVSEIGER